MAWPTLLLSAAVTALWVAATTLALLDVIPMALALALNVVAAFGAFTPMHDASHRSVSATATVNAFVGRLSSLLLIAPFPAFRWVHLEHHKHTNEPERDPDFWSGTGPTWMLPLRWLTQDLHYYVLYFEALRRRPVRERREVLASLVVF
ncbi:MAG: fatty acid desaturase, partial [Polyangiaceae bacterium]